MSLGYPPITVLTVTKGRPHLLDQCIQSVKKQDYPGEIIHLILIDDCAKTSAYLREKHTFSPQFAWFEIARGERERSGPELLADRRNRLAAFSWTEWVSLLDDDDRYETSHLRLLYDATRKVQADAAYSHIKVFYRDDTPFLEQRWPWCRTNEAGIPKYRDLLKKGIVTIGSNYFKESALQGFHYRVITGAWLLKRKLIEENPLSSQFSHREFIENKAEDDKLLDNLMRKKVNIAQSGAFTLRYYLGGYSNDFDQQHQDSQHWKWKEATPLTNNKSENNIADDDLTFYINAYQDLPLLKICLEKLRSVYPDSSLIVRSDGDPDPELSAVVRYHGGICIYGSRLMPIERGGKIVHEMLKLYLRHSQSTYLFKIDPDTYIFKKFSRLPNYSSVFGTVQHQQWLFSIQGGCMGFTRDVARSWHDSGYFLNPEFAQLHPPWAISPALSHRALSEKLTSFDWLVGLACHQCHIRMIDWPEVCSHWLSALLPADVHEHAAIAHPFK